ARPPPRGDLDGAAPAAQRAQGALVGGGRGGHRAAAVGALPPPGHPVRVVAWAVERRHEPAADFHARPLPDPARRSVWVCEPTGPALVLGSAQPDDVVDRGA